MPIGGDVLKEQLKAACRPLDEASTLPGECYTSAAWHRREVDGIFSKEWLCLGREDQIPNAGDYFRIDVVDEPILVVRDASGTVRVLSAVCRHRGTIIVSGEGNCRAFSCPYHSWTYSLQGELVSTPGRPQPMDDVQNFDKADYGLVRLRMDTWAGFIFVNLDGRARPLMECLGDLPGKVANYALAGMRTTKHFAYEVACNWKVYLENSMEVYHVDTVHRRFVDPKRQRTWTFDAPSPSYASFNVMASISDISDFPVIDTLSPDERGRTSFIWVHPNMVLILATTYVKFRLYLPLGPDRVRLVEHWCFPPSSIARPDFAAKVGPSYYDKYDEIVKDDLAITPVIQEGLRSRFYTPGRYSLQENAVHQIAKYVIERVEGERQR
jgi:choline monooxygenase